MYKLLLLACLLAFAIAAPKPLTSYYSGYAPAAYSAYSGYPGYAAGYAGYGYYGSYPYSSLYY